MSKKAIVILCVSIAVVLCGIAALLWFFLPVGGPYVGTVTDEGGAPVANVSVTDGRNVVKTDENGEFKLKGYKKTRFITVTSPAGYVAEKFYIPVSKETEKYDFTLAKSSVAAGAEHSFIQVSDTEIGKGGVGEWVNHVKKTAEETNAAFLIHTGDICYEDGLKRHLSDMNSENMGLPVYYTIGNHDFVDGKYGEELYESIYGPTWYSFEVGNVHYVVTPFPTHADYSSGYGIKACWRWLANDLANVSPDMKVVLFNHNYPVSDDYVLKYGAKKLDLKEHDLIAWVYGHYHYNFIEENNGVLNISTARPDSGGIDSSVSGTRQISVAKDGTVTSKMHYYDFDIYADRYTELSQKAIDNAQWMAKVDGVALFADTVYADGRVYVATADDNWPVNCGVYCIDAESGEVIWSQKTKNSIKSSFALQSGKLVAQDCVGNVYCYNAESGEKLWETTVNLGNSISTSTGICAEGNTVFTGCAAGITALNIENGEKLWENIRNKGECSAAQFIVSGDKLIVSSHWNALVALDKASGKELWKNDDEDIRFRSSTPVAVDDSTLLVADSDAIMLVDSASGEIKHKADMEGYSFSVSGQPAVKDGIAYIPTSNKGMVAYDLSAHKIVWEREVGKALIGTPPYTGPGALTVESTPVISGDKLIFGASDGVLYELSLANGEVLRQINVGAPVLGAVSVSADKIFFADFLGIVTCVK